MMDSSFAEIIKGRRSVRRFKDVRVSEDTICEIVDYARYAPSDTNSQTWQFVAVLDPEKIKGLAAAIWQTLHRMAQDAASRGMGKEGRLLLRSFGPYATAFTHAPALIVVLSTPYQSKFRERIFDPLDMVPRQVWDLEGTKSSCLAAQNLMLAAHAMGLATCPMTGPVLLAETELAELLGISVERKINMVISLGYPAESPAMPKRKPVHEILRIVR